MNAPRFLILLTAMGFLLAPLAAAALPSGRTAEAAALPSGRTAEAAGAPQDPAPAKPEIKAEAAAQAAKAVTPEPAAKKAPAERTEPILPAFQTPKEKTAVIVFFAWLWLSIGVLVYFLAWWVKEADRVFRARYYEPAESPRKDNPFPPLLGE